MSEATARPRVAIIGSGISGLTAAHGLKDRCELTLFEKNDYIGGHTHTHLIDHEGVCYAIDTGFIVFNDWTYPEFIALMDSLSVPSKPSQMSFSVHCERTGLEYNGTRLDTLFAQRRNLFSPRFIGMILDILRFNREAPRLLEHEDEDLSLGEYLKRERLGQAFIDHYIVPMGAAIWSTAPEVMLDFPARFFIRFFHNHGMLSVDQRPTWRVIEGGSAAYIPPLIHDFRDRIRLATPIRGVRRVGEQVEIMTDASGPERFDEVVIACHSDEALALLQDPSPEERSILGALAYQPNEAVLHTDQSLLPRCKKAWAAWNYRIPKHPGGQVAVTYNMNILQGIEAPVTFCVSLNQTDRIDPSRILKRLPYHHPLYTPDAIRAQQRFDAISGVRHTHYAGAYWGFGFHEDGVRSGRRVVEGLEAAWR